MFFEKITERKEEEQKEDIRWLKKQAIWNFVTERELNNTLKINSSIYHFYSGKDVKGILKTYAKALFKINCSYLSINYEIVERIYIEKNKDFFNMIRKINMFTQYTAEDIKTFARNIIIPQVTFDELQYVASILNRLSDEQLEELKKLIDS